jgi:siroheme synthase-like protein
MPVVLDVVGRPVLVVGAGPVGTRKARQLVAAGANVTVIAPEVSTELADEAVIVVRRRFAAGDVAGFRLVFCATGDESVNQAVVDDAEAHGIWVNAADEPARCSFYLPAVHRQGDVLVAVSTQGRAPALAGWLRDRLAGLLPRHLDELVPRLEARRRAAQAERGTTEGMDWRSIIEAELADLAGPDGRDGGAD